MWELKKINDTEYCFGIETQKGGCLYKFFLTDFCKLWCTEKSKKQIVDQCKNINQWLEAEDETLLSETLKLFDIRRTDVQWNFNADQLLLDSTFSGIKFGFYIDLQLANAEYFSKMIVTPLFLIIKNLQQQKEYLKSCLIEKDIEIAEYKFEGAIISRKNVETPVFRESLIPNTINKESRKLSFKKPSDLFDDKIVSSLNEIYSLLSTETAETPFLKVSKQDENQIEEVNIHEKNKIPKKKLSDSIIRVDNKHNIPDCSIPVLDPIRKKPQPRKLKNL